MTNRKTGKGCEYEWEHSKGYQRKRKHNKSYESKFGTQQINRMKIRTLL